MKKITVYTDGACSGNPGPGGWAAVLRYGDAERVITGAAKHTTNNRMELQAAIGALEVLTEPCEVSVCTDSAYLSRAFTDGWLQNWIKKGWKTASKKPVENRDLWERLVELTDVHNVRWIKVKGHSDDETNNRVDRLAVEAMRIDAP